MRNSVWSSDVLSSDLVHPSRTDPDEPYDAAVEAFTRAVVEDAVFVADLERFLDEHRIVELGRTTSLAQATLLLTSPGVPDIYPGTELWDHSMVDPDNRRPVDHPQRSRLLVEQVDTGQADALAHLHDGSRRSAWEGTRGYVR